MQRQEHRVARLNGCGTINGLYISCSTHKSNPMHGSSAAAASSAPEAPLGAAQLVMSRSAVTKGKTSSKAAQQLTNSPQRRTRTQCYRVQQLGTGLVA